MCIWRSSYILLATESIVGPYILESTASIFFFKESMATDLLTFKLMNLSGIIDIFWRDNACTLVLGKPCTIQLNYFFSNISTSVLTKSITMSSSTCLYWFQQAWILFPFSVWLLTSRLRRSPVETSFHWKCSESSSVNGCLLLPGCPVKKIRRTREKCKYVFRSLTRWWLYLLDKEVKRLFRSSHNQLLEQILKHLINLVFFEILLDLLHVVEFLELVHFWCKNLNLK